MEKIEKEIKVTRYVAFDGTEFETEQECRNYEGSAFASLMQQLENCTLGHSVSQGGEHSYWLLPNTRHDVFVIDQVERMAGGQGSNGDAYGHLTLMTVRLACNTVEEVTVLNVEDYVSGITGGRFAVVSTEKERK